MNAVSTAIEPMLHKVSRQGAVVFLTAGAAFLLGITSTILLSRLLGTIGLGLGFSGEPYYLPPPQPTGVHGGVAISSSAGPVWPMKQWAYYDELKNEPESGGLKVNILQSRPTLLEYLADV
jgi:hypothetical protein